MSSKRDKEKRVLRKDRRGANPVTVGLIMLLLLAVGVYAGFSKKVPFTHGFRVQAVFETSNNVRPNSPVRIAGVNIGKVTGIKPYEGGDGNAALVTMEIDDAGLPIHKDATFKVRPRIFLEGNEFVDLQPGTPSAPTIDDGDTIPMTQTSAPVQFDQVLGALQSDTRRDLQKLLEGYGDALTREPTAADDRTQDPDVHGETAAESLNDSIDYGAGALKGTAVVNTALQGLERHDLSGLVASTAKVTKALSRNEESLKGFVTNFNTTLAALVSERDNLKRTIAQLGPTLEHTDTALTSINNSFPNTRAFALELIPGVEQTPATIKAAYPWIAQTRKLVSKAEGGGLVRELKPATVDLARLVRGNLSALPQADLVSQCFNNVILPTGNIKIQDRFASGEENYKEFWYAMVGLAGEAQNFDGNGHYVRFAVGGGANTVQTRDWGNSGLSLIANMSEVPLGTQPASPGKRPAYNHDAPCKDQNVPDLNGAKVGAAETKSARQSGQGPLDALTSTTAIASTVTLPATLPTTTLSAKRSSSDSDLTSELVDRLNPFRKGSAR